MGNQFLFPRIWKMNLQQPHAFAGNSTLSLWPCPVLSLTFFRDVKQVSPVCTAQNGIPLQWLELALRRRNSEFVEVYFINALWSEHSKFCSRTMHVTTVAHHSSVITWQRDAQEARWTMYYKRYHHPHKFRLHSRTRQDKLPLNWRLLSLSFFFYRPAEIDWLIW